MSKNKQHSSKSKEKPVELGFMEEREPHWRMKSAFFPSKFGGYPAWLDLKEVPNLNDLKCTLCESPMKFLLQIYAPLDFPEAFHRTIYIFCCTKKECCDRNQNGNFTVLRCQLPRKNDFYSFEAPNEKDQTLSEISPIKFGVSICRVCGIKSTQKCSLCKNAAYCGKYHQKHDWKHGHKALCLKPDGDPATNSKLDPAAKAKDSDDSEIDPKDSWCFKEIQIVIDTENIPKNIGIERSEKERLEDFKKLEAEGKTGTMDDSVATNQSLLEAASEKSDKVFNKFMKRKRYEDTQVLRYDRRGEPLWASSENTLKSTDIPPCPYCKGARVFEFQIMPQILIYLGCDANDLEGGIDWAILPVYTCKKSCYEGPVYKMEFIWRQDFSTVDSIANVNEVD